MDLALRCGAALSVPWQDVAVLAAACELVHQAAIVHDDAQDCATTRRGRESIAGRYGAPVAIYVGDHLLASAFGLLAEQPRVSRLIQLFASRISEMAAGQAAEFAASLWTTMTLENYQSLAGGKAGAAVALPLEGAALLAGLSEQDAAIAGRIGHTLGLAYQRWRALLDEIFDGATVPDDPSLYLHRPAATDPSLQPPGQDGFYVLAPVPNMRAGIDWERAAPLLRDRVIAMLEERLLPGLSSHIVTERAMTPPDFAHDYLSRHGAGFSVAPTLLQSAWFRFHNKGPVPGLYLVGAGTHPGAGVPGVLTSAKVVEALVQQVIVR